MSIHCDALFCIVLQTMGRGGRHDGIPFEVKRMTPNAETRAALAEYDEMKKNPGNYKRYESFDALMDEVLADA